MTAALTSYQDGNADKNHGKEGIALRLGANVFLRADGRWEARYQKGKDKNGKTVYGFVYGKTRDEAEKKRIKALTELGSESSESTSKLASVNPSVSTPVSDSLSKKYSAFKYGKLEEPLTDSEAALLDRCLSESPQAGAAAFYLSLHMGLSLSEAAALRYEDLDMENETITVRYAVSSSPEGGIVPAEERSVPIPREAGVFLKAKRVGSMPKEYYVMSGGALPFSNSKTVAALFRRIKASEPALASVSPAALRSTFIRRCLEASLNIESVSAITGVDKNQIYKHFGRYVKADTSAIHRLSEPIGREGVSKELNLLILGAGSHGHNVKEVAESLGVFKKIKFLDDSAVGKDVIGKCIDCGDLVDEFPCAFVAIGDNEKRKEYAEMLKKHGFMLPTIIHPDTAVSKNAVIGEGTIILAQATVNAATVGDCCIVSSNSLINFGATVKDYVHVDCGAMVLKGAVVPEVTTVESGNIYRAM